VTFTAEATGREVLLDVQHLAELGLGRVRLTRDTRHVLRVILFSTAASSTQDSPAALSSAAGRTIQSLGLRPGMRYCTTWLSCDVPPGSR
jgi:hypothetical protein